MTSPIETMRQEVAARHTRYWDDEQARCANKRVVLVEGDDDRYVLEALLTAADPTWSTRAAVVVAGSRARVAQRLATTFAGGVGLVDRDVWSDSEAASAGVGGRLFVTAGWCLENTLLAIRTEGDPPELDAALEAAREEWVRAGALWYTLQRTRDAFNEWQTHVGWTYGGPRPDLHLEDPDKLRLALEARIPKPVRRAAGLDLHQLAVNYAKRLVEVRGWAPADQWLRGVHGKCAFGQVLVPLLNSGKGPAAQRTALGWKIARAGRLTQPPAPLDAILAAVL
jgi:hypothetical protein